MRSLRLTFLGRFTLVTLAATIAAAFVLAFVLESLHQAAVERDEIANAVAQINTGVDAAPLLPNGTRDLRSASRTANLISIVDGLRVYAADGKPLFPPRGVRDDAGVAAAAGSDAYVTVATGEKRTVYEPFVATNGQRLVLVITIAADRLHAQFARERWQVIVATSCVVALIAGSLIALASGASRELERRRREALATFVQTLSTLAETIDLRDPYTAGHSRRVAVYTRMLARELHLPDDQVEQFANAALLHDIGKVGIPDAVLFKPGALDADERNLIRHHPVIGAGLLRDIPAMHDITPCILHHHERIDGTGYPDGLAGMSIPLGARLIAVADSFDAMTTDRPYRRALTVEAALAELQRHTGSQFDPRAVAAFARIVARGEIVPPPSIEEARFAQRVVLEKITVPQS